MKSFLMSAIFVLAMAPTIAAAQPQQINIFTFEDSSCAAWSKSAGNRPLRAQYMFWIQGFVSGYNYASPARQVRTGTFPGSEALYQFLDSYCKDNPSLSFVGAAITLVDDLREPTPAAKKPASRLAPAKKEPAKAAPAAK